MTSPQKLKSFALLLGSLLLSASRCGATVDLDSPVPARAAALGEASTALTGDLSALHFNPAGLVGIDRKQTAFSLEQGVAGDQSGSADFGMPFGRGTLAAGLTYADAGDVDLYSTLGDFRTVKGQRDYVATVSYGQKFHREHWYDIRWYRLRWLRNVSMGVSAKLLRSSLVEEFSATAFALDAGALYEYAGKTGGFSLGLSFQNMGTPVKYRGKTDPLPAVSRAGLSWRYRRARTAVDLSRSTLEGTQSHFGLEYKITDILALRAGGKTGNDFNSMMMGFGLNPKNVQIDYALGVAGNLGQTHRLTFSVKY